MTTPTSNALVFDVALREGAASARTTHPAEAARIQRGVELARAGHVTLATDSHAAQVRSADGTRIYAVNDACACYDFSKAPEGRCKHRWATTLMRHAYEAPPTMYFASFTDYLGATYGGIAVTYPDGSALFYYDGCEDVVGIQDVHHAAQLVLGGCCGIVPEDTRPLWQQVSDPASYEGTWKGGR